MEDANYFEPFEYSLNTNISSRYEHNLFGIFDFFGLAENQFYFLTTPSFAPENLLVLERKYDGYTLTHTVLSKHYWRVFYDNDRITSVGKNIATSKLEKQIGDKLFHLLDKTIMEAKQPRGGGFVLDGINYKLSKMIAGKQKIVSKHSPKGDSKSGKIIAVMGLLVENINNLDNALLRSIEAKVNEILA